MQTTIQAPPAVVMEWVLIAFFASVALVVLYKILVGKIDLSTLLNEMTHPAGAGGVEPDPKASLSRLQLLLFTFVIAGLYLILCLEADKFVDIPNEVLGLLGISGGTYVVSKGIQANSK